MARSSGSPTICPRRRRGQPRQRLWRIVAKRAVLAAGATERAITFGGNDRPGVMMAAADAHLRQPVRGGAGATRSRSSPTMTMAGERPPISPRAGIEIAAIIDSRPTCAAAFEAAGARHRGRRSDRKPGAAGRCGPSRCERPREPRPSRSMRSPCRAAGTRMSRSPAITAAVRPGRRTLPPSCPERCRRA